MHGSTSRGLLAQNLTNPIPQTQTAFNYDDYRLCFDCHAGYPAVTKEVVLGLRIGGNYDVRFTPGPTEPFITLPRTPYDTAEIKSLFRDQYIAGDLRSYNDINYLFNGVYEYSHMPLHNLHVLGTYSAPSFSGAVPNVINWFSQKYRGDALQLGRITCTSCHNVHGTNAVIRSTYEQLQLTSGLSGADVYTTLPYANAIQSVMTSYPMNCTSDCHQTPVVFDTNSYWYSPANE